MEPIEGLRALHRRRGKDGQTNKAIFDHCLPVRRNVLAGATGGINGVSVTGVAQP
jgi:hypothetical protein